MMLKIPDLKRDFAGPKLASVYRHQDWVIVTNGYSALLLETARLSESIPDAHVERKGKILLEALAQDRDKLPIPLQTLVRECAPEAQRLCKEKSPRLFRIKDQLFNKALVYPFVCDFADEQVQLSLVPWGSLFALILEGAGWALFTGSYVMYGSDREAALKNTPDFLPRIS